MESELYKPTAQMLQAAALLERVMRRLLDDVQALPNQWTDEVEVEALLLMQLTVRAVEGMLVLLRHDLRLLHPALVISRTAMDTAFRLQWLLYPTDATERNKRFLEMLRENEDFSRSVQDGLKKWSIDNAHDQERVRMLSQHRAALAARWNLELPEKKDSTLRVTEQLLESINTPRLYLTYRAASQNTHGTNAATMEESRRIKEGTVDVFVADWSPCFWLCWYALYTTGTFLLQRLSGSPETFPSLELSNKVEAVFDALKANNS